MVKVFGEEVGKVCCGCECGLRKLRGNVQLEKMGGGKTEEWIGKVTWMSRVNGQVEVDIGRWCGSF